jgi:hypothetical protein
MKPIAEAKLVMCCKIVETSLCKHFECLTATCTYPPCRKASIAFWLLPNTVRNGQSFVLCELDC